MNPDLRGKNPKPAPADPSVSGNRSVGIALERWGLGATVFILVAGLVMGGLFYRSQEGRLLRRAKANLEGIAQVKAGQIVQWRNSQYEDARLLMANRTLIEALEPWSRTPNSPPPPAATEYFHALREHAGCSEVLLLDAAAQTSWTIALRQLPPEAPIVASKEQALLQRQPILSDLRAADGGAPPIIDLIVPLFATLGNPPPPVAWVVLRLPAERLLSPITQHWPTPSATAETLLVRQDQDAVLMLSDLRNEERAAMRFRIPMTQAQDPCVMAAMGQRGVVEATDHRGHPVLASLIEIPGSPWLLVTKVDQAEALSDWRARGRLILLVLGSLTAALCLAITTIYRLRAQYRTQAAAAEALRTSEAKVRAQADALQESELRFRKLFEESAEAILLIEGGRFIDGNRSALAMLGLRSVEEMRDVPPDRISPEFQPDGQRSADKAPRMIELAFAQGSHMFEWEHLRANRESFMAEVLLTPIRHRERHLLHVVWRDITQRKRAERTLKITQAELARSNTDLEQFAYVASHDLKSPLRAIDSLATWLQEDLGNSLVGDSKQHLRLMQNRVRRMERLLDDLLEYSRAGRGHASIQTVDVGVMLEEIIHLIAPPAGFRVRSVTPLPHFDTAVPALRQVLINLIANAIKHHDQAAGEIEISARDAGDILEFAVADDGPGIPTEFHERIFGMFQTLRPRDEVEGSGIGLALVKRIVTRYGGQVTVFNRPKRGVAFHFTWPKEIVVPTL